MHDRAAGDPTGADQQRAAIADDGAAGHPEIEFDPAEADDGADVDALGEHALDTARGDGRRGGAPVGGPPPPPPGAEGPPPPPPPPPRLLAPPTAPGARPPGPGGTNPPPRGGTHPRRGQGHLTTG